MFDPNLAVATATPDTIRYVVKRVVETVNPSKVILFGSHARGDQRAQSDVDLLVVTGSGEDREGIRLTIERALRGRRFGIDLLVRTPEDVARNVSAENPFYQDILREGHVMYER